MDFNLIHLYKAIYIVNWSKFSIDADTPRLKYLQLEDYLSRLIRTKKLLMGSRLPSVSEASKVFPVSRDTVLAAYRSLQDKGLISAQAGKGYYVASYGTSSKLKVFILFDAMNQYKETLYRSLLYHLGKGYETDIAFHYYNEKLFHTLVETNKNDYHFFILMPHFHTDVTETIRLVPPHKLLLLDAFPETLGTGYAAVYQDFMKDVYSGLQSLLNALCKYDSLTVIYNDRFQFMPGALINGIRSFASDFGMPLNFSCEFDFSRTSEGKCYMAISDRDLAELIKSAHQKNLTIGKEIGLLSFDDTPLKEVLAGGITTITTDFSLMGRQAAKLIREGKMEQIPNRSHVVFRNSL